MNVLQFGFTTAPSDNPTCSSATGAQVVYTGTHDNDTIRAW